MRAALATATYDEPDRCLACPGGGALAVVRNDTAFPTGTCGGVETETAVALVQFSIVFDALDAAADQLARVNL